MITININKILVPTDFSKTSVRAIKHAAYITKITQGELILLHVIKRNDLVDIILPVFKLESSSVITNYLENKMNDLAQYIRNKYSITVTSQISIGNITSEIVNIAEEHKVGLIIMGTQGSDSSSSMFLGSNSYRVLTKSDIPVMTIRSNAAKEGYSNILLPIDSSEHSRQKVNSAIQLAGKFGAHLHVLGLLGRNETNYENKLKIILPQIKKMAEVKKLVSTSEIDNAENPAEKTLAYAREIEADLIIIMSDQRAGLSSLVLGTYAHQLINNSEIPVLTIPPEIHPENMGEISVGGMW